MIQFYKDVSKLQSQYNARAMTSWRCATHLRLERLHELALRSRLTDTAVVLRVTLVQMPDTENTRNYFRRTYIYCNYDVIHSRDEVFKGMTRDVTARPPAGAAVEERVGGRRGRALALLVYVVVVGVAVLQTRRL